MLLQRRPHEGRVDHWGVTRSLRGWWYNLTARSLELPGVDYPTGTLFQPDEPTLPVTPDQLNTLGSVSYVALTPGRHVFDDFVIVAG